MKYLVKRYYSLDREVQSTHEIIESELDTRELLDSLPNATKPKKIELYKLVAEEF